MPRELSSYIVEAYVDMRQAEKERAGKTGGRGSMTARQLLSILRLAQALARLELRLEVTARDVDEAIRLVTMSKASVLDAGEGKERVIDADPLSRGWAILRPRLQRDPNGSGEQARTTNSQRQSEDREYDGETVRLVAGKELD